MAVLAIVVRVALATGLAVAAGVLVGRNIVTPAIGPAAGVLDCKVENRSSFLFPARFYITMSSLQHSRCFRKKADLFEFAGVFHCFAHSSALAPAVAGGRLRKGVRQA
jgi:hypothetical protein